MHTSPARHAAPLIGRGSPINPPNRFERLHVEPDPEAPPEEQPHPQTQFFHDATESILAKNDSPDVGFAYGINCYRGCEHVILRGQNVFTASSGVCTAPALEERRNAALGMEVWRKGPGTSALRGAGLGPFLHLWTHERALTAEST